MYMHFQHVEFRKQWKVDTILEDFKAPEVGGEREGREEEREGSGEEGGKSFVLCSTCSGSIVQCTRHGTGRGRWSAFGMGLHTGKHLSSLPGMPFPRRTPLFPSRLEFIEYLDSYTARFRLQVHTGVEATGLRQEDEGWLVETSNGEYRAKAVVVATGIMSEPILPVFDGMSSYLGQISHSSEYRLPEQSPTQSILIVGIRYRELRRGDSF